MHKNHPLDHPGQNTQTTTDEEYSMLLHYLSTHRCQASPALSGNRCTLSVWEVGDREYAEQFGVAVRQALGYVREAVAVIDDDDKEQDCLHCVG